MTRTEKNQVENLMRSLNVTEAEAIEIMNEDREIDRGAKLHELPDELKAGAKKARRAERKKTGPIDRPRKIDGTKKRLLEDFRCLREGLGATVEPLKTEAEMKFTFEGDSYSVRLIRHRSSK